MTKNIKVIANSKKKNDVIVSGQTVGFLESCDIREDAKTAYKSFFSSFVDFRAGMSKMLTFLGHFGRRGIVLGHP